ncbi:unnamed protein product [Dracunculus medinensis]|uniref:BTB domain-containing protein n=1 Tax=Dracunculus medinensis TaxID=318479 RepID=A0A0N4UF29_DRAME|nr:unnamed protein product [Dracunculus medinensis]
MFMSIKISVICALQERMIAYEQYMKNHILYVNAGWLAEISTFFLSVFFPDHSHSSEVILSSEILYEDVLELLRVVCYCPRKKPITVSNVAVVLQMAHYFGMQSVLESCRNFINHNVDTLSRTRLFQLTCALAQCDRHSPTMSLLIDKLSTIKEEELSALHFSEVPGDVVADVFATKIKRNQLKKRKWCCYF